MVGRLTASAQVEPPCHCRYISALAVIPYGQLPCPVEQQSWAPRVGGHHIPL